MTDIASDTPRSSIKAAAHSDPLLVPVLSAANFVIGMGAFVIIGILNPIATDLSLTTAQAGWIMTVYAVSYAILSPVLVAATGHICRCRVLTAGLTLFTVANIGCALAPTETLLYAARLIAAGGAGIVTPVTAAVAAATSPPETRGKVLASVLFGLTLAQVVGVPAGSFIAYTFGWRSAFAVVAVLCLPCIWMIWMRVPRGLSFQTVSLADLRHVLANGPVMLAVLFTTSFLGAIYVIFTFLGPLLTGTLGFGRDGITVALVIIGIGAVLGNYLGGLATDKLGPFKTLLCLAITQALIMPFFSTLPQPQFVVFAMMLVWSTFAWSFMAAQQVRLISIEPEKASVVLALNAAAIYVGAAVGSAIGGAVLSGFGLTALGVTGGLMALVAAAHIVISKRLTP
ncbi:MAG: MFS transporter [Pseudomonadota bacterium]